jgi:hypothetical protein
MKRLRARSARLVAACALATFFVNGSPATAATPDSGCSQTLQSLIDAAVQGSTLGVPACIYRETVTIRKPLTLVGERGAEIRGSDVWSAWSQNGQLWTSQQTMPSLPVVTADPAACDSESNACLKAEQVFFDGLALVRVPFGSVPASGEFALDQALRVVLADNPSGHLIEVSTRPRWIVTAADDVTIQGMTMRHAGNSALVGAISNDGYSNWTLQDSTLSDAHAANASLDGGSNVRVLRNDISHAGLVGISATGIDQGGLVQGNRLHDNRTADAAFKRSWGAGGLKMTQVRAFVVDTNEVDHNDSTGLWCDIGCNNVTFSNNRVHHNQWQGINFEISNGASIHDNVLWENGWGFQSWGWGAGIVISSSANAEVFNNTAAWNYAGISVIWQNRPDSPGPTPVGNYVHDNTIIKKTVKGDFDQTFWSNLSLGWLSDGSEPIYSSAFHNRADNNRVWYDQPESQTVRFAWSAQYFSLGEFRDTPGGSGTAYLSDRDKEQLLAANEIPPLPEI